MAQQRLITHPEHCRDCQSCTLACSLYHEGECHLGLARLSVEKNMAAYTFSILVCRHCDDPDCVAACPNEALHLDERGVAVLERELCLQCGACAESCPYHAIFYNAERGLYLKCDLCAGWAGGPLCAQTCPVGAVEYAGQPEAVQ